MSKSQSFRVPKIFWIGCTVMFVLDGDTYSSFDEIDSFCFRIEESSRRRLVVVE
jgi:hypothetical protein